MRTVIETWEYIRWFVAQMGEQFFGHDCLSNAGALTYTTLFAVVPMMTVAYAMFSVLPEFEGVGTQLESFIFQNFVPTSPEQLQAKLSEFSDRARDLTAVGFAFLFVTAFLMLVTIEKSFNTIWRVAEPRRGLPRFLVYWGVLSLGPPLIAGGVFISLYLISLPLVSDLDTFGIGKVLLGYVPLLASAAVFTVLYYAVPNTTVPFRHALIGGFVTMFAFELAKSIVPLVAANTSIEPIYGTFAAVPLFLTWLYLVWIIILAGAVFVRTLSLHQDTRTGPPEPMIVKCARILQRLYLAHMDGRTVDEEEMGGLVVLNQDEDERIFEVLSEMRLVRSSSEGWTLGRNLKTVTLWDLYRKLPEGLSLDALDGVEDMDHVVAPLRALATFGNNELSQSLDTLFATAEQPA